MCKNLSEKHPASINYFFSQQKLVNELSDAMSQGKGKDALGRVFNKLVDYTANHFKSEEKLMQKHGFPEFDEHKSKHDAMTGKVLQLKQQYEAGTMGLTIKTMNFLENWLTKHIKGTDMEYGRYLTSKGVQ